MLNDSAGDALIPHRDAEDMPTLMPAMMRYLEIAKDANNCTFEMVEGLYLVAVRAARPINRGEELTVSYGVFFWLHHIKQALASLSSADRDVVKEVVLGYNTTSVDRDRLGL